MNPFQKIGVFLIRVIAFVCLCFGIGGFVYFATLRIVQIPDPGGIGPAYAMASLPYLLAGIVLASFANLLGRLLGYGLGDPRSD